MTDLSEYRKYIVNEVEPARNWKPRGNLGASDGNICPICGSGSRGSANSDGALSVYDDDWHWYCYSCRQGGDIYTLYELRDGLSKSDAARAVLQRYGDGSQHPASATGKAGSTQQRGKQSKAADASNVKDFSDYVERCHRALAGSPGEKYLMGRGLKAETLNTYHLGYDAGKANIVIPYPGTANTYYVSRPIQTVEGRPKYYKPPRSEAGAEPIFNAPVLYSGADVVFIVESQLCALSVQQQGGTAIAIGGSGTRHLLTLLEGKPTQSTMVICLDNDPHEQDDKGHWKDEQTRKKAEELSDALQSAGFYAFIDNSICGAAKDPNDSLQADEAAFTDSIRRVEDTAREARKAAENAESEAYQRESAAGHMDSFGREIQASVDTPPIPTGFSGLDSFLGGGLFAGLYFIGAVSSLGKTSLGLQIIDQIAEAGTDCLIFSLEMSQYELMAKSISRMTYQYVKRMGWGKEYAKSTRDITNGRNYARYSPRDFDVIDAAEQRYRSTAGQHIWIFEGVGNIGVDEIRRTVGKHARMRKGSHPVVLIDYLQILAPFVDPLHPNRSLTDRQALDKNILELKRLSRDFRIPVLCISSFNRESYNIPVGLTSYKESGCIEFSADVLLGLQYTGMEYQEKTVGKFEYDKDPERLHRISMLVKENNEKAKRGEAVELDVKILKNRNGARGTSNTMMFTPTFNYLEERNGGQRAVSGSDLTVVFGKGRR